MNYTELELRESYINGELFPIGQRITPEFEVIDRRSNYIVCIDRSGKETKMFLKEAYDMVTQSEKKPSFRSLFRKTPDTFSYKGYAPRAIPLEYIDSVKTLAENVEDAYGTLHAIKAIDQLFESRQQSSFIRAKRYLENLGVLDKHSYINLVQLVEESEQEKQTSKHKKEFSKEALDARIDALQKQGLPLEVVDKFIHTIKTLTEEFSIKEAEKLLDELERDDKELEKLVDQIEDLEDIAHHYSDDELHFEEDEKHLKEHLSRSARIKRKISFMKSEPKRLRMRKLALHRLSSASKIAKKARKAAIELIKMKLTKKDISKLTISDKERLEDLLARRKDLIKRLATRLIPKIRKIEQQRIMKIKI
jgi:myosin heavy subunit